MSTTKRLFMMFALLLTAATGAWADDSHLTSSADVGKVVCTDHTVYATVAEAKAAGKTPVAMVAYVNEELGTPQYGKALAISLEDAPITDTGNGGKHDDALSIAEAYNTSHPVTFGTWRLPSVQDWEHMLIGCGSTSTYVSSLPNPSWSSDPYADDYLFEPGNIRTMMVAAGGTDFTVNPYQYKGYWSSTGSSTTGGMWWSYWFDFGNGSGPAYGFALEVGGLVRPCVEILAGTPHNLTLQEGTEDAEHWTINNPFLSGRYASLKYSGNRIVKSVKLLNSGTEAYSPYSTMMRRPDWSVNMPDYDDVVVVEYDDSYTVLSYNEENYAKLIGLNGQTTNVVINTVLPQGWSVLTLPFDLPDGFKPALGLSAKEFVGSSFTKGSDAANPPRLKLFFEDVTNLKAGVPYLVKAMIKRDLFNSPFENVTVSQFENEVMSKYADFVPTYDQKIARGDVRFVRGSYTVIQTYPYVEFEHPYAYYPGPDPVIDALSGYFYLKNIPAIATEEGMSIDIVFGPYVPEPDEAIKEETTEKPGDTAKAGEVITSESGITTALGEDDTVDEVEGSVTMHTTLSGSDVENLFDIYAPGTPDLYDQLKGIYFLLAAGEGKVEIEMETLGNVVLGVFQGITPDYFTASEKGKITIEYNVETDTWFVAYPVVMTSAEAPAFGKRAPDAENALKIYSVKIIPKDETGVAQIRADKPAPGSIYNLQGQRVSTLHKGLYIIDGRKVIIP